MCGRYEINKTKKFSELILSISNKMSLEFKDSGEIFPGDTVIVIASNKDKKESVYLMKWGYSLNKKLIFNARSEEIKEKTLFKEDYLRHRCVIPISYYYEWDASKSKFKISDGSEMMYLAGIYRISSGGLEFTILTKNPGKDLSKIHNRMPVVIKESDVSKYINPDNNPDEIIKNSINELLAHKVL